MKDEIYGTTKTEIRKDFQRMRSYMRMFESYMKMEERVSNGTSTHITLDKLFNDPDKIAGITKEIIRIANVADAYVAGRQLTLKHSDENGNYDNSWIDGK